MMGSYEIVFVGAIEPASEEIVVGHLDRVMEELVALDADNISIDVRDNVVQISLTVETETSEDALAKGSAVIKTALQAAEAKPTNWLNLQRAELTHA